MSTTAGIDIGSDAIKGVVLRAGKKGPVEVVAAGTMPIADLSRLPESEDRALAIGTKLKELVRSAHLKADTRRVGAAGSHTSIRYLQIPPVPPWRLEMLVNYEVDERNEEKEKQAYDYHIMDVPETNGQYTVIVGTVAETFANELLSMSRSSGLGEVEIDMEALALFSAYYHGHGFDPDKTVAIADIGSDDITVLICKNGTLFYARTMMGGGKRFTQNLADDMKIEWSEAEELKKTIGEISFEVAPASGASGVNRAARLPRSAPGGTTILNRPAVRPASPGASAAGVPAVGASAIGAAGAVEVSGKVGASAVRSTARPAAASTFRAPGADKIVAAITTAPAATQSPKQTPAQDNDSMELLDLDALDLNPKAPAAPSAPLPQKTPTLAPPAPAPGSDLELQLDDEKPAAAKPPVAAAATIKMPAPFPADKLDSLELATEAKSPATVKMPAIVPASTSASDSLDDELSSPGGLNASAVVPSLATNEERDRRRRQMSAALVREAAGLCAAIENVLMACKAQSKQPAMKIDRLYITGGASKLKGLSEFMARRLRVEVMPLEPLRNLSLNGLRPEEREALKAEQHTFHTALGLALSDLRKGTHSFLIWPKSLKQSKEFWARGAYLYYAAGAAAIAMGLMLYTPARNTSLLVANDRVASDAVSKAERENAATRELEKSNNELRHRLKTITDNVSSGDYFLTMLAELKSKQRIRDDIYLTSISTTLPNVVVTDSDADTKYGQDGMAVPKNQSEIKELLKRAADLNRGEPNTFQAQRRVYIRGIARGPRKEGLIELIKDFYDRLVPFPKDPDNPQNLFKDIRPIWYSVQDNKKDNFYLKEFVLEAYTDQPPAASISATANLKGKTSGKGNTTGSPKAGASPTQPAPVPGMGAPSAKPNGAPQAAPANPNAQPVNPTQPQAAPANPAAPNATNNGQQPGGIVPYLKSIFQDPAKAPVQPQPVQPVQPAQPAQPVPLQPLQPAQPAQPVAPAQPVQPVQPVAPVNPQAVPVPVPPTPVAPVAPVPPIAPVAPIAPAAPVVPVAPGAVAPDAQPKPKRVRQFVAPTEPAPAAPVPPAAPVNKAP